MTRNRIASTLFFGLGLCGLLAACGNEVRDDTDPDAAPPYWAAADFADLPDEISEVDRTLYAYAIGGLDIVREHRGFCYCDQGLGGVNVCDALTEVSPCFAAVDKGCMRVGLASLSDRDYAWFGELARVRGGAAMCGYSGENADCDLRLGCYELAIPLVQAACEVASPAVLELLASCPYEP